MEDVTIVTRQIIGDSKLAKTMTSYLLKDLARNQDLKIHCLCFTEEKKCAMYKTVTLDDLIIYINYSKLINGL